MHSLRSSIFSWCLLDQDLPGDNPEGGPILSYLGIFQVFRGKIHIKFTQGVFFTLYFVPLNLKFIEMLKIAKEGNQYMVELFQVNRLSTLFSDLVREQLMELVQEPGAEVIFNLGGIRFIDSSGFAVLVDVADRARMAGNRFKLCNVTDDVRELILLLELEGRFNFCSCDNVEEKILLVLD
jgi:anti-anti-sigma factor